MSGAPKRYSVYRSTGGRRGRHVRGWPAVAVLLVVLAAAGGVAAVLLVRGDAPPTTAGAESPSPHASPSPLLSGSPSPSPSSPSPSPSPGPAGAAAWTGPASYTLSMHLDTTIGGSISPKSVVATQTGLVFAQNMMYTHTITVYSARTRKLVKTISDQVTLADYGYPAFPAPVQGAPVEAAVSADGEHMYISNYSMYGPGFTHQGDDVCAPGSGIDDSYVYRVRLSDLSIDQAIRVGAVPKYVATSPDGRYLLVSNWCSYNLSVVDTAKGRQIRQIYLGPYPRGIAVDSRSRFAYVAVMGAGNVARIDLRTFRLSWISGVGITPRHLCISPNDRWLYVSLNAPGAVAKVDLRTRRVVGTVVTGQQDRSMTIAPDGKSLYVVNYGSNTVSKVRAADLHILQTVPTSWHPIGITYDAETRSVWVACYGGQIMVFDER